MHGGQDPAHPDRGVVIEHLATLLRDPEVVAQQGLGGDSPEADDELGSTNRSSASSQGRQALMWLTSGVAWIRRFPRSVKRKCLTALVT